MKSITIWNENKLTPKVKDLISKPIYEKLKELKYPISILDGIYLVDDKYVEVVIHNNTINKLNLLSEVSHLSCDINTQHLNYYLHTTDYQISNDKVYDIVNESWISNNESSNIDIINIKDQIKTIKEDLKLLDINNESHIYDIIEKNNMLNKLLRENDNTKINKIKTIKNIKYYNTIIEQLKSRLL